MADVPSSPVDGYRRIQWVPTIADTLAPKMTEINAASAKDLSCYFVTFDGTGEQATIADPRVCSVQDFERPGKETRALTSTYIVNPQSTTDNVASVTLAPNTPGFFIDRTGIPYDTAFAVGQKVDVWPVTSGVQSKVNEAGSVSRASQKQFVTGRVRQDVAIVA
jgi:hypothetical protein